MVNVRVEMPRTSCHLSIFSLGKRGFQLGLAVSTDHAAAGAGHQGPCT